MSNKTDDAISQEFCCVKLKCFSTTPGAFFRDKIAKISPDSCSGRRTVLSTMLCYDGTFSFNGRTVCSTFLLKAFRFSRKMQVNERKTIINLQFELQGLTGGPSNSLSEEPVNVQQHAPTPSSQLPSDAIITFQDRVITENADQIPDTGEFHLPFFSKQDVYHIFRK